MIMLGESAFSEKTCVYRCTTDSITVSIEPMYLADNSDPLEHYYVWAYNASIVNRSDKIVQILRRKIVMVDCQGKHSEVEASGVVGEQPILKPGEEFEYTSGAYLYASSGMMYGRYCLMDSDLGKVFTVLIPSFSLDSTHDEVLH